MSEQEAGFRQIMQAVVEGNDLDRGPMTAVMQEIMSGRASPAQTAGLLVALRMKGETALELATAASVMRDFSTRVEVPVERLVDTCGTGGDAKGTFNISTASAFVVAAAGCAVAKHGNRSVSGTCGSADVLEAAGAKLELTPGQVARCIEEIGIGFLFAPMHHSAMKHAAGVRRELGVRTMFNLLGPLTNPAGATHQVLGVFSGAWVEPIAEVLRILGSRHALVVHADDGLDEISTTNDTRVAELNEGSISTYRVSPREFGIEPCSLDELVVQDVQQSLAMVHAAFGHKANPASDIVKLNAGAALYACNQVATIAEGVELAAVTIESGEAQNKFKQYIEFTRDI